MLTALVVATLALAEDRPAIILEVPANVAETASYASQATPISDPLRPGQIVVALDIHYTPTEFYAPEHVTVRDADGATWKVDGERVAHQVLDLGDHRIYMSREPYVSAGRDWFGWKTILLLTNAQDQILQVKRLAYSSFSQIQVIEHPAIEGVQTLFVVTAVHAACPAGEVSEVLALRGDRLEQILTYRFLGSEGIGTEDLPLQSMRERLFVPTHTDTGLVWTSTARHDDGTVPHTAPVANHIYTTRTETDSFNDMTGEIIRVTAHQWEMPLVQTSMNEEMEQ